jgi:multidrug efflux pump
VPLALAGTCAGMWAAGFSINNLSLMALAISVGFVVDDAIVMIENMSRNLERGMRPYRAAIEGARQIGFTVISISLSLLRPSSAVFMGGVVGRLFHFGDAGFAIAVSTGVAVGDADDLRAPSARRADATGRPRSRRRAAACRLYAHLDLVMARFLTFFSPPSPSPSASTKIPKGYFRRTTPG